MLLAVSPLAGYTGFLQILLIILSGILCTSFIITVIAHYRKRKKKNELEPEALQQILASSPENVGYRLENDYLLIDHSGLIRDYKSKLVNHHARYTALKQDFEKLEDKYNSLLLQKDSDNPKTINMEPTTLAATGQQELETENIKLPGHAEQAYMKDLLREKEAQITFLQQQLDQRIRHFHQSEQSLTELKNSLDVNNELLQEKSKQVVYLENTLKELREQNEMLNAAIADEAGRMSQLEETLEQTKEKCSYAEQRLQANKQLMQRVYNEFSQCMEDSTEKAPLVMMHPMANVEHWEEPVAQS